MTMNEHMVIQGRTVTADDLHLIRRLIKDNPCWHRKRLSIELCQVWNWRAANGQLKDMSCRNLLLKLERGGHLTLPPPLRSANNSRRHRNIQFVAHQKSPIIAELQTLRPVSMTSVEHGEQQKLFKSFLSRYHYLGYSGTVGENIKYMAFDRNDNPLACLLFGAAAWKIAARDTFIGWDADRRKRNLHFLTNNMRFLILPWIRVPHLASHLLGQVARRICADWLQKYGHPIYLLETFVEHGRFYGTCYQAANWRYVGQTKGRTRNDRDNSIQVPIKDVYLYPLTPAFREVLQA
jgi:hypothetical protein